MLADLLAAAINANVGAWTLSPDSIGDLPLATANKNPKDYATRKASFVAMVQHMDKLEGRILTQVESLGLLENTLILFTADNATNKSIRPQGQGIEMGGEARGA